jgi:hypothetical protein
VIPTTQTKAREESEAAYSVTQKSSSQPEREAVETRVPRDPNVGAATQSAGCDAAECLGELSPSAMATLRASAAKAQDCYETELKSQPELEGRWTVLLRLLSEPSRDGKPCPVTIEQEGFKASDTFRNCLVEVLGSTQAKATNGCVDVALPLAFVRQEITPPAPTTSERASDTSASGSNPGHQ